MRTLLRHQAVCVAPCDLGLGLFAGLDFKRGELVLSLTGPVISLSAAIAKGEFECNALQIGRTTYIDLCEPGIYANHSCTPNVGIRGNTELFALRDISQGEEIRYDYSTTMSERRWTMECRCGSPVCRGVIRDFHELPTALQSHYLALRAVQPFIVGEWQSLQAQDTASMESLHHEGEPQLALG